LAIISEGAVFDIVVRGGEVIDGSGRPGYRADVGVRGDRTTAIGDLSAATSARSIDATGRVVAPGFIDVHTHSDGWLLRHRNFWPKTSQGFTTELLMADGIAYAPVDARTWRQWVFYLRSLNGLRLDDYLGWQSIGDYMQLLEGRTSQNVATHVPFANVRTLACGFGHRPPDDFQMRSIRAEIQRGMEQGAVGLSTGLDYIAQCWALTDELVSACSAIAPFDGLYVTHVRYKAGLMPALREAVEIGRRAGVRVHISHLKATSSQETDEVLGWIDREARHQVDLSFDIYPYQRGSTMLNYLLPYEAWEDGPQNVLVRMGREDLLERFRLGLDSMGLGLDKYSIAWTPSRENVRHHGRLLSDYVAATGEAPEVALYHLLVEENLAVLLTIDSGDDALIRPFLQHDLMMMGSDGIYFSEGTIHPRVIGSAPRLIGQYVREQKLFTLETAVQKMTHWPARRFGLKDRGVIREGAYADLVVFDPKTVADRASYERPHETCIGIEQVIVNGEPIVQDATPIDPANRQAPGRYLRYQPHP
jgi:N-acyl-D-amino-acid deacylase